MYNWQQPGWPLFEFDAEMYTTSIDQYSRAVAQLLDRLHQLDQDAAHTYFVERLVEEAAATSEIEGEIMSRDDLMSSLLNNLNLGGASDRLVKDRRARAIGQQIVLNRETFARPLTETALKYWHELLLGYDNSLRAIGEYRQAAVPMQIISGPDYKREVHFEAPPAASVPAEMRRFVAYCNGPTNLPPVLRAGVAHLYFESIHPFEDGNGRLGRAILEKLLSQDLGTFVPYSLSHAIEVRRKEYYQALNRSSHSLDITPWLTYFFEVLSEAVAYADTLVTFTLHKQRYFGQFADRLEPGHRKAIDKLFAAGPAGFQGGMTTKKYMRINRVSQATAARALRYLTALGALTQHGAGRSTHYRLPEELPLP